MVAETALPERPGVEPSPFRRLLSLVGLAEEGVRTGWLSRVGRLYAWSIALGYAVLVAWWTRQGEPSGVRITLQMALSGISWAGGVVAWAAARDLEALDRGRGRLALPELRGFAPAEVRRARVYATMYVVIRAVGRPALVVTGAALLLAPTAEGVVSVVPLVLGVAGYALAFGVVLGGLSRWASSLSTEHGRTVFAALVLVPLLARDVLGDVPNVVSSFKWLIERVVSLGALSG